jgi:hypothetical protein
VQLGGPHLCSLVVLIGAAWRSSSAQQSNRRGNGGMKENSIAQITGHKGKELLAALHTNSSWMMSSGWSCVQVHDAPSLPNLHGRTSCSAATPAQQSTRHPRVSSTEAASTIGNTSIAVLAASTIGNTSIAVLAASTIGNTSIAVLAASTIGNTSIAVLAASPHTPWSGMPHADVALGGGQHPHRRVLTTHNQGTLCVSDLGQPSTLRSKSFQIQVSAGIPQTAHDRGRRKLTNDGDSHVDDAS